MTSARITVLWCDYPDCHTEWFGDAEPVATTRRKARHSGWTFGRHGDRCPEHRIGAARWVALAYGGDVPPARG